MEAYKVQRKQSFITSADVQGHIRDVQLSSKVVEGPALPLEGVHHVHGSDSLPLGVLRVGDGVLDGIFQEDLENTVFLENVIGDTLFAFVSFASNCTKKAKDQKRKEGLEKLLDVKTWRRTEDKMISESGCWEGRMEERRMEPAGRKTEKDSDEEEPL